MYGIAVFVKTQPKSDSGYNQIVSIIEMYEMVGLDESGQIAHEYAFYELLIQNDDDAFYITNRQKYLNNINNASRNLF